MPARGARGYVTAAIVVGVFGLAGVLVLLLSRHGAIDHPGAIPVARSAHQYTTQIHDGTVLVEASGRPVIDIFEDPLCPSCGDLEAQIRDPLSEALAARAVTVRYHVINFLDPLSDPPGYPLNAANALLCSAQNGFFPDYHTSLFAAQPTEGSSGYSIDALVELGTALAAPVDFSACVRSGRYNQQVRDQLRQFMSDPRVLTTLPNGLQATGTPSVLINGAPTPDPAKAILQLIDHQ